MALKRRAVSSLLTSTLLLGGAFAFAELKTGTHPDGLPPPEDILRYQVVGSSGYSISDLQIIRDFIVERRLKTITGVVKVAEDNAGDNGDIVQGLVIMRRDAAGKATTARAEAEIEELNEDGILPPGVRLIRIYDPAAPRPRP